MGKLLISQQYPPSIKIGSSSVSKVMVGDAGPSGIQVWPATGYYTAKY